MSHRRIYFNHIVNEYLDFYNVKLSKQDLEDIITCLRSRHENPWKFRVHTVDFTNSGVVKSDIPQDLLESSLRFVFDE